jgi:hypothetical protein
VSPIDPSSTLNLPDFNSNDLSSNHPFYEFDYHEERKPNILYKILSEEKKEAAILENTRLIYVASTRARSRLHLLGCLDNENGDLKEPASKSLLSCVWPAVSNIISIDDTDSSINSEGDIQEEKLFPLFKRPKIEFFLPLPMEENVIKEKISTNLMLANSDEGDNQKKILGICAHEIYELIIKNRNIYFFDDKELYEKKWRHRLISLGMPKDHLDKSMFFLNTVICKAKSSSLLKWILSDDNILLCSEWSLTSYNSKLGRFVKNIIDCSFVDKNKCRWILDFKFSTPKENESYELTSMSKRPECVFYFH